MRIPALFVFLWSTSLIYAQPITLSGTVVLHNSQFETGSRIPVERASIRADAAKAVTTDKDGGFVLQFLGLQAGSSVRLTVTKPGFEVVNGMDLDRVTLGRITEVEVVLAESVKLAEMQLRFYAVARGRIEAGYARSLDKLRNEDVALETRLNELGRSFGDTLADLGAALELLERRKENALAQAVDLARSFSLIDLDNASAIYREAYQAFQRGEVDSTLLLLDKDRLDKDLKETLDRKARGEELIGRSNSVIRQVFDSYRLRADVFHISLDLRQELAAFVQMKEIMDEHSDVFVPLDRAYLLRSMGLLHHDMDHVAEAHDELQESLDLLSEHLGPGHDETARARLALGMVLEDEGAYGPAEDLYRSNLAVRSTALSTDASASIQSLSALAGVLGIRGQTDSALVYLHMAFDSIQGTTLAGGIVEAELLRSLGLQLREQMNCEEALAMFQRSTDLKEELIAAGVRDVDLNSAYTSSASAFNCLERYPEAMAAYTKALELSERKYGRIHSRTSRALSNIATTRMRMGDHQGALQDLRTVYGIDSNLLQSNDGSLATHSNNMAYALSALGRHEEAVVHYEEALRIFRIIYGVDHARVVTVLHNMSGTLLAAGRSDEALSTAREALAIRLARFGENSPLVADAFWTVGDIQMRTGHPDSSLASFQRVVAIGEQLGAKGEMSLASGESGLGQAEERLGHGQEAMLHYQHVIDIYARSKPPTFPGIVVTKARMARCARSNGDPGRAVVLAEDSYSLAPNLLAAWVMHECAQDAGRPSEALRYLVDCARAIGTPTDRGDVQADLVLETLRQRAHENGRPEVLKEFENKTP
ncbi:MAG TPA: tetratricopeptide repeat protein [Flavobacteriales bacterium]|nr:tetratricopeptide repeat protein [Flavobacteriales bacterium]